MGAVGRYRCVGGAWRKPAGIAGVHRNRFLAGAVETVTGMGGTVERAEKDQIERVINHSMKERFSLGTAERAVLLEYGDDPAIGPP